MRLILIFSVFSCGYIFVNGQNDGQYRPPQIVTTKPPPIFFTRIPFNSSAAVSDGRYRGGNDGRYRGANDGKYRGGNDGRYVSRNDGKYMHIGDGFRGIYSGGGGEYTGSGSGGGQYISGGSNYVGGGQYTGGGGQYTGGGGQYTGGGGQYTGGSNKNSGIGNQGSNNGAGNISGKNTGGFGSGNLNSIGTGVSGNTAKATKKPSLVTQPTRIYKPTPPSGDGKNGWAIIQDIKSEDQDGYHYLFETENGILAEESGRIEALARDETGLRSQGFYQYTGDDGILYRVDYVADNDGFVPTGDHIPTVPPHVIKLLEYLAVNAPQT